MSEKIALIGAGGHAKVVLSSAQSTGLEIEGFVDSKVQDFCGLTKLDDDYIPQNAAISFGATKPEALKNRHEVYEQYLAKGAKFPAVVSKSAIIQDNVEIGDGCFIAPSANINHSAAIKENTIINTGAIIEHDVKIGSGCHIAPGAVVLGGAEIEDFCMIGSSAVILPNAKLESGSLVKALERYGN